VIATVAGLFSDRVIADVVAVNDTLTVTLVFGIVNVREFPEPLTETAAPLSLLVTLTAPIE